MREFTIYAQAIQGNGYHPVCKFRRDKDGIWFRGNEKVIDGKNVFIENCCQFPMKDKGWNNHYYEFVLEKNYSSFFKGERFGGSVIYDSEMTIEEVKQLINS